MAAPRTRQERATSFGKAVLDTTVSNAQTNCNLTLVMNLFLEKIDPAVGAAKGTHPDHNGTDRKIIKWGGEWSRFTKRFHQEVVKFWHGQLWLKTEERCEKFNFSTNHANVQSVYRPNIYCRFELNFVRKAADAAKKIKIVRLDPSEDFFRSNSSLWDSKDVRTVPQPHGSPKKTHVHEIGHILGLGHVGAENKEADCVAHVNTGGSTNDTVCYGVSTENKRDIMGTGSELREWHAKPWQIAMQNFTGTRTQFEWKASTRRVYPTIVAKYRRSSGIPNRMGYSAPGFGNKQT